MNKALIAHWTYDKDNGKGKTTEIEVQRLIGIYETVEEASFIERKAKKNFEVNCSFKIEDTKNKVTSKASVSRYMEHLRGRNGK
jgi:hypothetical protein